MRGALPLFSLGGGCAKELGQGTRLRSGNVRMRGRGGRSFPHLFFVLGAFCASVGGFRSDFWGDFRAFVGVFKIFSKIF